MLLGLIIFGAAAGCTPHDDEGASRNTHDWRLHLEVSIPYGGETFPEPRSYDELRSVDDEITNAVENSGVGAWEGQSVGAGTYDVGFFADDEKRLLGTIEPILRRRGVAKGTTVEIGKNDATYTPIRTVHL